MPLFLVLLSFIVLPTLAVEWTNDTHYDFGDLPYGKAVQYEFPFKNVGDEALVIDNVRASCGMYADRLAAGSHRARLNRGHPGGL
jgi:hypothetical protein